MISSSRKAEMGGASAVQYYEDGSGPRMKLVYDSAEQEYTLVLPGDATCTGLTDDDLDVLIDIIHAVRWAQAAGRRACGEDP